MKPRIAIDLGHLRLREGTPPNGTAKYALELLRALQALEEFEVSTEIAGADLVHRPAQVFSAIELLPLLEQPAPLVVSYLDLIAYRRPEIHISPDEHARYRAASIAQLRSAHAVIAISEHNKAEIVETFGLPEARVHAIPLGVDARWFADRDAARNAELLSTLGVKRPYLLYVGSDYPHKNLELLLAGYSLCRGAPDLVLAGPAIGSGGVYSRPPPAGVSYLGVVSTEALRALYQEAHAFVFPSAYEGFGLPLLEAMAAGTPVVAAFATALPEAGGDACLWIRDFTPEEVAGLLARVDSERADLIERGRARAAAFSWNQTARRTAEVYEAVLDEPRESLGRRGYAALLRAWLSAEKR